MSKSDFTEPSEIRFARALLEGGMAKEAEPPLRSLLSRDPDCIAAWRLLGQSLSAQHRPADAVEAYRHVYEVESINPEVASDYGIALMNAGRFAEAVEPLSYVARCFPRQPTVLFSAGLALYKAGDSDRALELYEAALGIDPDFASAQGARAELLRLRRRPHYRWVSFPELITLDNHRACNARCRMCPTQNIPLELGRMEDAVFDTLVSQLRCFRHRITRVQFGVHGEPLLDRSLEQRVAQLVEAGIDTVCVITNGSALTAKRARGLISAGLKYITLALDGITAETFEQIRIGLSYEMVLRNTLEFIRIRDELDSECSIAIRLIEQEINRGEIPAWLEFWQAKLDPAKDSCTIVPMHNWTESVGGEPIDFGRKPCGSVVYEMVVSANGDVPLCCVDYDRQYHFGSIRDAHLLDIFNQPSFASVRRTHQTLARNTLALCNTCSNPEGNAKQTSKWSKLVWNDAKTGESREPMRRNANTVKA